MSIKHTIAKIILISLILVVTNTAVASSTASKMPKIANKPFLITGQLPHYTPMLMKVWDDPELGLSDKQKRWLKVVREETIHDIRRIAQKTASLERQVANGIKTGMEPDQLLPTVKEIAALKTEATMVHLKCIYDTRKILTEQQLKWLENRFKNPHREER